MSSFPQVITPGHDPEQSIVSAALQQFGRRLYVCSFHFMRVKERREYKTRVGGAPWTDYILEPVRSPQDHPSVCLVMDGFQRVFLGTEDLPPYRKNYGNNPEPATSIAADIIKAATGGEPSDPTDVLHPSVWLSSIDPNVDPFPRTSFGRDGKVEYSSEWDCYGTPEFASRYPKFAAECAAYAERQWHHAEMLVSQGDSHHSGPQANPRNINERHRLAAQWINASSAQHPWIERTTFGSIIACPFCGRPNPSTASKCQGCGEIVNFAAYEATKEAISTASAPIPEPLVTPEPEMESEPVRPVDDDQPRPRRRG